MGPVIKPMSRKIAASPALVLGFLALGNIGRCLCYWDRSRARPAVGGGFPFLLFRLQDGFTVPPWLTVGIEIERALLQVSNCVFCGDWRRVNWRSGRVKARAGARPAPPASALTRPARQFKRLGKCSAQFAPSGGRDLSRRDG